MRMMVLDRWSKNVGFWNAEGEGEKAMIYPIAHAGEGQQLGQRNRRQQEHILGRTLLNMGLQREYAPFLSQLTVKTRRYGKPYLEEHPEIQSNTDHYDDLVVCVLHNRMVGLDVEVIRPFSERLVKKVLTEEKLALLGGREMTPELFFRHWALKESYLKIRGTGLVVSMRETSFSWKAGGSVKSNSEEYVLYQKCLWGKYLIIVYTARDSDGDEEEKERTSDDIPGDF